MESLGLPLLPLPAYLSVSGSNPLRELVYKFLVLALLISFDPVEQVE